MLLCCRWTERRVQISSVYTAIFGRNWPILVLPHLSSHCYQGGSNQSLRYDGGLVAKSSLTLVTPWTVAHQAPLSMGFFRQEYWSRWPFPPPGDLPNPEIEPVSVHHRRILYHWTAREALGTELVISNFILTVAWPQSRLVPNYWHFASRKQMKPHIALSPK